MRWEKKMERETQHCPWTGAGTTGWGVPDLVVAEDVCVLCT